MASLNINNLRSVEWDTGNLWDIRIDLNLTDGVNPFNDFVPVSNVDLKFNGVRTSEFAGFGYIAGADIPSLEITFFDDENLTMVNFFKDWMADIAPLNNKFVRTIEYSKRLIEIRKYNKAKKTTNVFKLWVIPTGSLTFTGQSDSTPTAYSLSFIVVGGNIGSMS